MSSIGIDVVGDVGRLEGVDLAAPHHPQTGPLAPARVHIPGVLEGGLGVGGVEAPDVHMGDPTSRPNEDLPHRPCLGGQIGRLFDLDLSPGATGTS